MRPTATPRTEDAHPPSHTFYDLFTSFRPRRVLLVEGDRATREPLARALEEEGYLVLDDLGKPLSRLRPQDLPDLVIADMDMVGGPSGLDILGYLRRAHRRTPVILLADHPDPDDDDEALQMGADYVLDRGCSVDDVRYAALSLVVP